MENKCIATVMDRVFLRENLYLFLCNHVVIGDLNEKNGIFKDLNGNEFTSINDIHMLYSEISRGFANMIDMDSLKELFPGEELSKEEALKKYESYCKSLAYYVYVDRNHKDTVVSTPINLDELEDELAVAITNSFKSLKENDERYEIIDEEKFVPNNTPKEQAEFLCKLKNNDYPNFEEEIKAYDEMDEEELSDTVFLEIQKILSGHYSLDELKEEMESLTPQLDDLHSLYETIELQIETMTNEEMKKNATEKGDVSKDVSLNLENVIKEDEQKSRYELEGWIDVEKIFNKITKTLINQDEPTRRMLIELARMELKGHRKNGILLTGNSGVGKTKLMSLVAKYLNRPVLIIDSTQITAPGYVGRDIENYLWDLYIMCDRDLRKTENAIIYFDEIDKKGSEKKSDVSGKAVLNLLLKFMDGSEYIACENSQSSRENNTVRINTKNMRIVVGGAFGDVYLDKKNNEIGFLTPEKAAVNKKKLEPTVKDFVEKAMMTNEFMGRSPIIIHMNPLDEEAIKKIILNSDESLLLEEKKTFKNIGTELEVTEGYIDAIAKKAYELQTGARGIDAMIENTTWKPFDIVYTNIGEYEKVILDEKTVEDSDEFQLIKKRKDITNTQSE